MKRLFLVLAILCSSLSAFPYEFFKINDTKVRAYSYADSWADKVCTYHYNDVVRISEFEPGARAVYARVADVREEQWIDADNLTLMTPKEVATYRKYGRLIVGYPWAHFDPYLGEMPFYTVLYWITVAMAIYSLFFFLLFFKDARWRGNTYHYVYGVCSLVLCFWVFRFGTCQWLLIGFLWAALIYPLGFTRLPDEEILRRIVEIVVIVGCIVTSWMFLRMWEKSALTVGFFSWLLCILLTFVNLCAAIGMGGVNAFQRS